jgi:hypothetical protein
VTSKVTINSRTRSFASIANWLKKKIPFIKQALSFVLLICGVGFILVLVVHSWEKIEGLLIAVNWYLFFWSVMLGIAGNVLTSVLFRYLLVKHGLTLPYKMTHKLFFYAQIAKYIPGQIWGIVYQTSLVYREGKVLTITTANIDLMIISIITSLAIALVIISIEIQAYASITIFLIGLGTTVFIACSCFLGNAIDWSLSKFKAEYVAKYGRRCKPAFGGFPIAVYYCVVSVIGLLAYYLMIHAVFGFSVRETLTLAAYLILAWVAGVLAFIVPAGVGVREFLFIAFGAYMVPTIPVEVLATIAVISRCWQVLQEIAAAAAIFAWGMLRNERIGGVENKL